MHNVELPHRQGYQGCQGHILVHCKGIAYEFVPPWTSGRSDRRRSRTTCPFRLPLLAHRRTVRNGYACHATSRLPTPGAWRVLLSPFGFGLASEPAVGVDVPGGHAGGGGGLSRAAAHDPRVLRICACKRTHALQLARFCRTGQPNAAAQCSRRCFVSTTHIHACMHLCVRRTHESRSEMELWLWTCP